SSLGHRIFYLPLAIVIFRVDSNVAIAVAMLTASSINTAVANAVVTITVITVDVTHIAVVEA
ncbi:hypothetical protein A2U01_0076886, partial [Trifolium medium]|nr:hypothetical protein [Trifolium medium]